MYGGTCCATRVAPGHVARGAGTCYAPSAECDCEAEESAGPGGTRKEDVAEEETDTPVLVLKSRDLGRGDLAPHLLHHPACVKNTTLCGSFVQPECGSASGKMGGVLTSPMKPVNFSHAYNAEGGGFSDGWVQKSGQQRMVCAKAPLRVPGRRAKHENHQFLQQHGSSTGSKTPQ